MKGKISDTFITNSQIYYDYGKLYQSILGYDAILYNHEICHEYANTLKCMYENWLKSNNIDLMDLKCVTFSLVIGTFHFIKDEAKE